MSKIPSPRLFYMLASLLALVASGQGRAEPQAEIGMPPPGNAASPGDGAITPPDANEGGKGRWQAPQAEDAKRINDEAMQANKVRLGLRLTPFQRITTRSRDGKESSRYVPTQPLRHTLRARLNQINHFFVGEWHIETVPQKWLKKTQHYEVRLNIYRRYGAFGQLEESVGGVDLQGVLDEANDHVQVLIGVARGRLRDKLGNPVLDVVAGFAPGATKPEPTLTDTAKAPATPPPSYSGELIRGRF